MTPERRAEIEAEAKAYLNYSAHPEVHAIIRELLAEIDRLNTIRQEQEAILRKRWRLSERSGNHSDHEPDLQDEGEVEQAVPPPRVV